MSADCGAAYAAARHDLLRILDRARLDAPVPATPAWTVRDVVAHLIGIAADLNAQRFPVDGDAEAWTAAQVTSRRLQPFDEVVAEWEREAPAFEDGLRLFGYELGSHYVGDLLQHSQDVRSAIGARPLADDDVLGIALDHYLHALGEALDDAWAVTLAAGARTWTVGGGEVVASVRVPDRLELLRMLGGRRSVRQVLALPWEGDAARVAPLLSAYGPRSDDLDG